MPNAYPNEYLDESWQGAMKRPYVKPDYAFTEIRTFNLPHGSAIEDEASEEGQIWTKTVRTYLENEGTGLFWWGRLLDAPQTVKVVVDWKSLDQQSFFEQSTVFAELQTLWETIIVGRIKYISCIFPEGEHARLMTKSEYPPIVSTIFTFHFSNDFERIPEWNSTWSRFSEAILLSDGGCVASGTCGGWSLDHKTFCGVAKYLDIPTMEQYLADQNSKPTSESALKRLRDLTVGEMNIEFANMLCLREGWQGSAIKTRGDHPELWFLNDFARIARELKESKNTNDHPKRPL